MRGGFEEGKPREQRADGVLIRFPLLFIVIPLVPLRTKKQRRGKRGSSGEREKLRYNIQWVSVIY